jgi:hypothetical protein
MDRPILWPGAWFALSPMDKEIQMRSWSITAWPRKLWHSTQVEPTFTHLDTQISEAVDTSLGAVSGQTSWVAKLDGGHAALAWDWVLLRPGVLAIGDPMTILTNIVFVDHDGVEVAAETVPARLNTLVHHLPWQAHVRRSLRELVKPTERQLQHLLPASASLNTFERQLLAA